jgi:hypothetical protein
MNRRRFGSLHARLLVPALIVTAFACSSSDNGGTGVTPSITITINPTSASVQQGGSAAVTATITGAGGFTGAGASFNLTGAPAGVTFAVSNVQTTGSVTTATVTVSVASTVAAGTYPITFVGSGTGVSSVNVTFTLTVTAAPTPSYTLSLTPTSLSIAQGANGAVTVSLTRTNFPDAVTLAASGLPTGVTAAFNTSPTTGTSATLTLTASATATTGTANVTITGTATGQTNRTATLALTVTAVSAGNFSLAATAVSVVQGGSSGTSTITITRTGGLTAAVGLTVTGAPTGMTASLDQASTTGTGATLTVQAAASVATGNYTLTIHGTVAGLAEQTASVTVTVTAGASGNFTLASVPASAAVTQGGAVVTTNINITRTGGFAGSVTLTVTGLTAGLTATFNPASTTGTTSSLSISASATATTGNVTLTIHGNATGLAEQTTPVAVTVSAAGGSGNVTVDYSGCAANAKPVWVAFQNGTGAWTQVIGAADVYKFNVTLGKGGYAAAFASGATSTVNVQLMTQAELTAATIFACGAGGTPVTKTVNVTVNGLGATDDAFLSLGGGFGLAFAGLPNPISINGVQNGTFDLLAYRTTGGTASISDKAQIIRDLNVPAGGSAGTVDFNGANAFAAATATMTVAGLAGGETLSGSMNYLTGAACTIGILNTSTGSGTTVPAFGIPAAQQRATDFHFFQVTAAVGTTSSRSVTDIFHTLADKTETLGAALTPTVTSLPAAYKDLQVALTIPSDYNTSLTFTYGAGGKSVAVNATAGWIGGSSATVAFPNFAGTGGWLDTYAPASGATASWTVSTAGFNLTGTTLCAEGAKLKLASVSGSM